MFSDDIYERLVYTEEPFANIAMACPAVAAQTITFNCLSKSYAMTGWRCGYTVASTDVIKAMDTLQGQMTSNITSFVLASVATALESSQDEIEAMRKTFAERAAYIHQRLVALPGLACPRPTGAFYVFPDISAYLGRTSPRGPRHHRSPGPRGGAAGGSPRGRGAGRGFWERPSHPPQLRHRDG